VRHLGDFTEVVVLPPLPHFGVAVVCVCVCVCVRMCVRVCVCDVCVRAMCVYDVRVKRGLGGEVERQKEG